MAADNSGYLKFLMSAKMNFYRFKNWGKERLETESKSLWSKLKEACSLTIKYNGKAKGSLGTALQKLHKRPPTVHPTESHRAAQMRP
jgi:hypothetical protein